MLGTEEVTPDWWGGDGVLRPRWTTAGPGVRAAGDVSPNPQLQKGRTGHRGGGGEAGDVPVEVVGVRQRAGELHGPVQVLAHHDVHLALLPDFGVPVDVGGPSRCV